FSLIGGNYLAAGDHEQTEAEWILKLLKGADLMVDVGANSGLYSCLAASAGVSTVAVEPAAANVRILCLNLKLNQLESRVAVFPAAVGGTQDIAALYGRGQGASLVSGWGGQSKTDYKLVPVHRLDDLVPANAKQIVLKVDTEGTEFAVLHGATNTLKR